MPTTPSLKNIPDDGHERLRAAAQSDRRRLNSEAIVCLETVLVPGKMASSERLARVRSVRAGLDAGCSARDIDAFKRQGRA